MVGRQNQPRPLAEVHSFPAAAPVPYHLPELIARPNDPVLIPAGEKDADNLLSLGLLATTNHGGEGKWWPELTPYFKDRRVFLLLDNDTPGETHCAVVGAALKVLLLRSALFGSQSCSRRVMFLTSSPTSSPPTRNGRRPFPCRRAYRRSPRLIRLCSRGLSRRGSATSASGCNARLTTSAPLH